MARAQFDRDQVLDDSVALFWRHGFNGTSMQQVKAATGLKPGSLYLAFGSKEGLYKEALKRYAKESMDNSRQVLEQAPSVCEGVCELLENIVQQSTNSEYCSCFVIKTQLELAADKGSLYDFSLQCLKEVEALYREYLSQEFDVEQSAKRSTSLMLHIFGARVYGYQSASIDRLRLGLREGLPWLPWLPWSKRQF